MSMEKRTARGMDAERLASIPGRMSAFVEKGTIAGAVTLVARHGVIASLEAVGYQDLANQKPMRTDTIFQIRSMTKPITAAGIMILIEEGRLVLADPVEKHLPEFAGVTVSESPGRDPPVLKSPSRPMTIRDLLGHSSGMLAWAEDYGIRSEWRVPLAEAVTQYSRHPLQSDPGTTFLYSDVGFSTLGRVIEVVSNQRYERFVEERILEPLGMNDSFFFPSRDKLQRIATAYKLEGGTLKEDGNYAAYREDRLHLQKNPCPAWGMYSTALDLFAFFQMMQNGGTFEGIRILSQASVELMTRVHTGELEDRRRPDGVRLANYGLGWRVAADPMETLRLTSIGTYSHGGISGVHGWVDPQKSLVGLLLVQRFDWPPPYPREERDMFMAMAAAATVA